MSLHAFNLRIQVSCGSILWLLCANSCTQKKTSAHGLESVPVYQSENSVSEVRGEFRCPSELVPEEFVDFAKSKGVVDRSVASALYFKSISLVNPKDKITGYDAASFYFPNMAKFSNRSRIAGDAVYLEVDIGNLGGLNSILTNAGADIVLRQITGIIDTELALFSASYGVKVCKVRHGGDEFSYFLKSKTPILSATLEKTMEFAQQRVLNYAQSTKIDSVLAEVEDPNAPIHRSKLGCLAQIPHPKKSNLNDSSLFAGTGIYFASVVIPPTEVLMIKPDEVREYFQSRVMVPAGLAINVAKLIPSKTNSVCLTK